MYDWLPDCAVICVVFFFKQKTAYEMRISDWSSDVCSSDLQLLLSLRRMNRLRHIDEAARLAVAEAGVILETFHNAVLAHGLRLPLTLGGKGSATIGALVSTTAGGTPVRRHGTMSVLVAGIGAALPDGRTFDGHALLQKANPGSPISHPP